MDKVLFTKKDLINIIAPLFMEQLLVILVGVADTLIISYAGEAAVSGVSLVNQFNTIFIYLFTALASGGAVVISQYIGNQDKKMAGRSSSQLLSFSVVFSLIISILLLIFGEAILHFMFGKVEPEVMNACMTYLRISAYSYPMLAIYNAGAAVYRSIGKTDTTMYISIISNIINIVGNCIGIFILHAGVAGVAWPSFVARTFSAVVITYLCFKNTKVSYDWKDVLSFDKRLLNRILGIAIPNGVESGVFQFVKVALSSIVALFGTYQIAANGIAQSIWSLAALSGVTMGPVFITVIGQCMGANDKEMADYYFKELIKITLIFSIIWNALILSVTPFILRFYAVSIETKNLVLWLVVLHNIFNAIAFPFAGALGNGLRATGDVKYTMYISLFTTICIRLVFSYIFALILNMGVMGIAWAMCLDWGIKGILQFIRLKNGKWNNFNII